MIGGGPDLPDGIVGGFSLGFSPVALEPRSFATDIWTHSIKIMPAKMPARVILLAGFISILYNLVLSSTPPSRNLYIVVCLFYL